MSVGIPEPTPNEESEELEEGQEQEEQESQEEDSRTDREKELEAKLKKANDQAAKYRTRLKEAQETAAPNSDDVISKARAEEATVWKTRLATQAAITALTAKGVEAPGRLLKLISFDDVEIEDDGSVSGLDDQIEELESDLPQLFPPKRNPKPPSVNGGTQGRAPKKTTAQQFAESLKDF